MEYFKLSGNICIFGIVILIVEYSQSATRTTTTTMSPRTASAANCFDQGQECPYRVQLCNNTLYFDLMSWQCPRTCNRCPPGGADPTQPPTIQDPPLPNRNCKDFLDCPIWAKNGFCTLYSNETKADFCPITCRIGCAIGGPNNYGV